MCARGSAGTWRTYRDREGIHSVQRPGHRRPASISLRCASNHPSLAP
jgi:hypothetical protein